MKVLYCINPVKVVIALCVLVVGGYLVLTGGY